MSYIKREFIRQVLEDEGKRLGKNQGIEIEKRLKFHTRRLIQDRTATVTQGDDLSGKLTFTFPAYLRFLDMKRKVKRNKKSKVTKIKKGYRLYNRFVMGHYNSIAYRLQNEFSSEVADAIRKDLIK